MRNIWSAAAKLPLFVFTEWSLDGRIQRSPDPHERDPLPEYFSTLYALAQLGVREFNSRLLFLGDRLAVDSLQNS